MRYAFSYLAFCAALISIAAVSGCSNNSSGPAVNQANFTGTAQQKADYAEKMNEHFGGGAPKFTPPTNFNPQKLARP
jgi:hypothetical protein